MELLGNAFSQQVKCQQLSDWKDRLDITWKHKILEPKDQKCHSIILPKPCKNGLCHSPNLGRGARDV